MIDLLKQAYSLIGKYIEAQEKKEPTHDYCVILDAGHGSINPEGDYVTAPSKMFRHPHREFHKDGWFYEGVFNRQLLAKLATYLLDMDIPFEVVSHEWKDTPRHTRVHRVNELHKKFNGRTWGISIHSNASQSHNAEGWSVWTSKNRPEVKPISDRIADVLWRQVDGVGLKMRSQDYIDGDHDYEANFDMVYKTKPPFVLIENGFFDNPTDADWLFDESNQWKLAKALAEGIQISNQMLFNV